MPLSAGDKLGAFEILSPLGAGGMGEVWKARDTRLGRSVAIKVLPEYIAQREELRARFEREAHTVASLNHPHICALYDIGDQGGTRYMVMELLEGETLASRIERGAIPLEQAVAFAIHIADALDRAHRAGVTHRDVKPGNIMLTRDGAKVVDFGLARPAGKPGPSEETLTQALTSEGTVLGTPQYMAPEQFEGKEADARADIWAFGAVLYEMVTGRKAFQGKSYTSLVGAILGGEPAPMAVKPFTPAWLERLVRRCLQKDPDDRFQAMRDIVLDLRTPAEESAGSAKVSRWPWIAAFSVATLAFLGVTAMYFRATPPEQPVLTTSILPLDKARFNEIAISPDGKLLAFAATTEGKRQLWVRPLDANAAHALDGTEQAQYPFWSPDSRWIGFFADRKLKKVQAAGGTAQTLCNAIAGNGGTWNPEGVIVYGALGMGLWRVPAQGGAPVQLVTGEFGRGPVILPGGRRYLYYSPAGKEGPPGIYIGELDSEHTRRLVADSSRPGYAEGPAGEGYLLFVREGTLMAQRFDPGRTSLSGDAFPVAEGIGRGASPTAFLFSVSGKGMLVYSSGFGERAQLEWRDRNGKRIETLKEAGRPISPSLSPDEKQVAFTMVAGPGSVNNICWVRDLARGASRKFTFSNAYFPVWSPDGGRIVFSSSREGTYDLYIKSSAGAEPEELLLKTGNRKFATDWAANGRLLLYNEIDPKTKSDLWVLPMEGERKPAPFLRTEFNEGNGTFAPNGKWFAYNSDESGRSEVWVQPYPATGAKWQISRDGGLWPRWRRDGTELYWLEEDGTLMAAKVRAEPAFEWGIPQPLFETGIMSAATRYAVSGDGKRFLVSVPVEAEDIEPLTLVQNWLDRAKR